MLKGRRWKGSLSGRARSRPGGVVASSSSSRIGIRRFVRTIRIHSCLAVFHRRLKVCIKGCESLLCQRLGKWHRWVRSRSRWNQRRGVWIGAAVRRRAVLTGRREGVKRRDRVWSPSRPNVCPGDLGSCRSDLCGSSCGSRGRR